MNVVGCWLFVVVWHFEPQWILLWLWLWFLFCWFFFVFLFFWCDYGMILMGWFLWADFGICGLILVVVVIVASDGWVDFGLWL